MAIPLDLETSIALACAASLALILCLVIYAVSEGASGRRLKRRLAGVRDRAQGVVSVEAAVTRSPICETRLYYARCFVADTAETLALRPPTMRYHTR
jgi:thiosulfate reductase cytochrome b subunit